MAGDSDHNAGGTPPREPKFVAVAHQKGGTGKTTTVCNLASCFTSATPGLRVVVLDLDPQAASSSLLHDDDGPAPVGAYEVIVSGQIAKGAIRRTKVRNCLLVPATERLVMSELDEATRALAFADVKRALRTSLAGIDVVLIDCPAGLGTLATLAMAIADIIVLPTPPQSAEVSALRQTADHVRRLRRDADACLAPAITMWDADNPGHTAAADQLRAAYRDQILAVSIPRDSAVDEAAMNNELTVERNPDLPAALAYRRLAALIGARLGFAMAAAEPQDEPAPRPHDDRPQMADPLGAGRPVPKAPSIHDRAEPHAAPIPEILRAPPSPPSAPSAPPAPDANGPPSRPSVTPPSAPRPDDAGAVPEDKAAGDTAAPAGSAPTPWKDPPRAPRGLRLIARLILAVIFLAASAIGTFLVLLEPTYLAGVAVGLAGLVGLAVSAWYLKWI